ncbi:MAG: hypothetical protein IJ191_04020 [Treponema sp.]|nr:hypothetical protein [Treponema sp.]
MTKFFLILVLVLVIACLALFFLWWSARAKQKETQDKLDGANKELTKAIAEQAKLESTIQILKKNRKEADEKISDLHNGDSVSNALNELHKRQD